VLRLHELGELKRAEHDAVKRARGAELVAEFARAEEALVTRRVRAVATIFADRRNMPTLVRRLVFEFLVIDLGAYSGANGEWLAKLEVNNSRQLVCGCYIQPQLRFGVGFQPHPLGHHTFPPAEEPRVVHLAAGGAVGRIFSFVAKTTTAKCQLMGKYSWPQDQGPQTDTFGR
jgi:hypothetical protein